MTPTVLPSAFVDCLVATAKGQVGVREVGNNGGKTVRAYQSATWLEPGPWPWCAAFVCWCFLAASLRFPDVVKFLPTTPRAFGFEDWARKHGFKVSNKPTSAMPGDVVVFEFPTGGHVGIVASRCLAGKFETVEGNTNGSGGREGEGVYLQTRKTTYVRSIIRLT